VHICDKYKGTNQPAQISEHPSRALADEPYFYLNASHLAFATAYFQLKNPQTYQYRNYGARCKESALSQGYDRTCHSKNTGRGRITVVLGSFADMPTDLKSQIDRLEELFVAPTAKLKEISDHFVSELQRGLSAEGGTIVSLVSLDVLSEC
jgi:hypothetical protein